MHILALAATMAGIMYRHMHARLTRSVMMPANSTRASDPTRSFMIHCREAALAPAAAVSTPTACA